MFLGFDDTDSANGMCTTYLTSEIILRTGLDVIGYPSLVRLNPNIGYKTRGNGAISLRLGKGDGKKFVIGRFDGRDIYGYPDEKSETYVEEVLEIAKDVISEFAVLEDDNTNPGAVISPRTLPEELYYGALQTEVNITDAESVLYSAHGKSAKFKLGRGIVGSSAALAWKRRRVTYELLSYQYPRPDAIGQERKMSAAGYVDETYASTFNNLDRRNGHAAIFPVNRTPVIYGVRSVNAKVLPEIRDRLSDVFHISGSRSIIYETNQGTDDHLVSCPNKLWEGGSFNLVGEITQMPYSIHGGHYFTSMTWKGATVGLAAFEPTKEFREVFRELRPGDMVSAMGSMGQGNLKLEKLKVFSTSRFFRRSPPVCRICGSSMKNNGMNDYRCRKCGSRSRDPEYREERRNLSPGNYEVPVTARRHLSMPLRLEDHFVPAPAKEEGGVQP